MKHEQPVELQCSFCGKHQREVRKLIAGPTVYICDECIGLCNDIIAEDLQRESSGSPEPRKESLADPVSVVGPGISAVDEAVRRLRGVEERLPDQPVFVSHTVSLLESSAALLRAGLRELDARARSAAAEEGRRRELERQQAEATQAWARAHDQWERTRATVTEIETSVARLRGTPPETAAVEHRLLIEDVGLKLERLREGLGHGGFLVAPDPRASAVAVLVTPNFWRIARALGQALRDGARTLSHAEVQALEGGLSAVLTLGEQLALEISGKVSRWRPSEIRVRLEELEKTIATVQQHGVARLSLPLLGSLGEVIDELRSLGSRLAALDPAEPPKAASPQD